MFKNNNGNQQTSVSYYGLEDHEKKELRNISVLFYTLVIGGAIASYATTFGPDNLDMIKKPELCLFKPSIK